jgi:hypothetical protein
LDDSIINRSRALAHSINGILALDESIMNRNRALAHSNKWYFGI